MSQKIYQVSSYSLFIKILTVIFRTNCYRIRLANMVHVFAQLMVWRFDSGQSAVQSVKCIANTGMLETAVVALFAGAVQVNTMFNLKFVLVANRLLHDHKTFFEL